MEEIQKKDYKSKKKIWLKSLIFTVIIVLIILCSILVGNSSRNKSHNSYIVSGEVLTACEIYPNIWLQIEDKEEGVIGVILNDSEYVSQILLSEKRFSDISDFSVKLSEYNGDNNKDFVYVNSKKEEGYDYKFYSIDKKGIISELGIEPVCLDINKASVKMTKTDAGYEYIEPIFYYDDYKVIAEIGEYKLNEKVNVSKKKISKDSKLSVVGNYNPIPRKIVTLKNFPEYMENANDYMKEIENKQCIECDLDGDGKKEYIVLLSEDNNVEIGLFDSSFNFLVNLFEGKDKKNINDILEIADVDNDKIMEIIIIDGENIKVHKYNNGFFY